MGKLCLVLCPVKNKVIFITNRTKKTGNTTGNPDLFSNFLYSCTFDSKRQLIINEVIMTLLNKINQKELRKRNQQNN